MGEENNVDVTALDDAALDAQLIADDDGTPEETEDTETQKPAEQKENEVKEQEAKPVEQTPAAPETEEAKAEKLAKQVADKEAFIGKQTTEIGELRRQAAALQEQLAQVNKDDLNARYYDDPAATVNEVLAIREQEAQVQQLQMLANIKQNEVVVKEYVPDFDDLMDDMVETLKELKYDPEIIKNFKINPYNEQPAIVVNLAERARLSKENKSLKAQIAELNQRVKTGPEDALKKVEKAARQVVTGATGKSGASEISKANIPHMSNAQLDEILNGPDDE